MNPALTDITRRLKAAGGRISTDDVLAMRREIYGAPRVTEDEVASLVELDGAGAEGSQAWAAFLGDAMTDLAVRQADPEDFVSAEMADWLMRACAGPLRLAGGVDALVRVIEAAEGCPPVFDAFVLAQVRDAVIAAGEVDAGAVALLRRCVFAGGGEDNIGVTRAEADALFAVDAACGARADAAWPGFFAQAIDDCLTAVSPFHLESRDEAARDEAWLKRRPGLFDFFKGAAHKPDFHDALRDLLDPYGAERDEWREADARMDADEAAAATITDEEARWLIGRLGEAPMTPARRALVGRLQGEDPGNPALKPLFDAA